MPIWSPERKISLAMAAATIAAQFPALAPIQIQLLGVGWDNAAFLVNAHFVFRFPRRQIAAELLEIEASVLPAIAPLLPLPIPTPTFLGEHDDDLLHETAWTLDALRL